VAQAHDVSTRHTGLELRPYVLKSLLRCTAIKYQKFLDRGHPQLNRWMIVYDIYGFVHIALSG